MGRYSPRAVKNEGYANSLRGKFYSFRGSPFINIRISSLPGLLLLPTSKTQKPKSLEKFKCTPAQQSKSTADQVIFEQSNLCGGLASSLRAKRSKRQQSSSFNVAWRAEVLSASSHCKRCSWPTHQNKHILWFSIPTKRRRTTATRPNLASKGFDSNNLIELQTK